MKPFLILVICCCGLGSILLDVEIKYTVLLALYTIISTIVFVWLDIIYRLKK